MKAYSVTDVGQKRRENQDYVFASEQPIGNLPNLFVVADGMGGHNAGDFASRCAVSVMVESVKKDMSFNPIKIIRHAIETANEQVGIQAELDPGKSGMGTTLVAVTVVGYYAYIANVGDSRLYVLDGELKQITIDHSLVEEMVRMGGLDRAEARNHPKKNIITRAIGALDTVRVDFFEVELKKGDMVLLCSDGLTNMLEDKEIEEILKDKGSMKDKADRLISAANENGGKDNIAVVLIEPFAET